MAPLIKPLGLDSREFNPILFFASGVVGLFRMTEGKAKRAYSFQAVRAETIFVGSAQPLGLRVLQLDRLAPTARGMTEELTAAGFAVFDPCAG